MRIILLPALLLSQAAVAKVETGEQQLAKLVQGRVAGKADSCLPIFDTNDSTTVPGIGIWYRDGGTSWLGRFSEGCQAGDDDIIVTSTPMSHPCHGDIIHVFDRFSRIEHGACTFESFTPYKKPKAAK